MSPLAVSDSLSNREEHVVELARRIGRGHKRTVFEEVYRGQKQTKTVAEIASTTGLSEIQVLKAGVQLVDAQAIQQTAVGGRVAYAKINAHKAIKDRVLRIAGNAKAIAAIPTKRAPRMKIEGQIFAQSHPRRDRKAAPAARARVKASAKVAFLMASPVGAGGINVGMDYREALAAVQISENRDKIELRPFLAASAGSLLDALNEFGPDVVHFSGHGGGEAILMDRAEIRTSGGMVVNFELAKKMLSATDKSPTLLVLAACETVEGAETFLSTIPVVIAMSNEVSDWAAAFFSKRFYAALVGGRSIGHAFEQAKAFLEAERLPDADLPTILHAVNADPCKMYLVK